MTGGAAFFDYNVRVGYADTDRMGFVHHSRYLVYMESARTELLRSSGESYREWEERGYLLPLVSAHLDYHRAARYDDMLRVRVTLTEFSKLRVRFDYAAFCDERGEEVARGYTAHIFMDKKNRPRRAGPDILEKMEALSGDEKVLEL